jgi:hypothetical protein
MLRVVERTKSHNSNAQAPLIRPTYSRLFGEAIRIVSAAEVAASPGRRQAPERRRPWWKAVRFGIWQPRLVRLE